MASASRQSQRASLMSAALPDRRASRASPVSAWAVTVGSPVWRPIARALPWSSDGALVVARPEREQARPGSRRCRASGRDRPVRRGLIEPLEALVESLPGHPDRGKGDRQAERVVGPAVVDEPLQGRDQVGVLRLELAESGSGVKAPERRSRPAPRTPEAIPRMRHPSLRIIRSGAPRTTGARNAVNPETSTPTIRPWPLPESRGA